MFVGSTSNTTAQVNLAVGHNNGSTVLQTPGSILTLYPHIYKSLGYDALRDLTPVSTVCTLDFALVAGPGTSVQTIAQFVDWCKTNPDKAIYTVVIAGVWQRYCRARGNFPWR